MFLVIYLLPWVIYCMKLLKPIEYTNRELYKRHTSECETPDDKSEF